MVSESTFLDKGHEFSYYLIILVRLVNLFYLLIQCLSAYESRKSNLIVRRSLDWYWRCGRSILSLSVNKNCPNSGKKTSSDSCSPHNDSRTVFSSFHSR